MRCAFVKSLLRRCEHDAINRAVSCTQLQDHPFPDLVDEELDSRRTSHAPVYIDKDTAPPTVHIGNRGLTMQNKVGSPRLA